MNEWWFGFLSAFIPSAAGAVLGWARWYHEVRAKRVEREARQRAEAELQLIRRRSLNDAPYLVLSDHRYNGLEFAKDDPNERYWMSAFSNLMLCAFQHEIGPDVKDGDKVYLLLENKGSAAQEIGLELDGESCRLRNFEDHGMEFPGLEYTYHPDLVGKDQTLTISFLSPNGMRDTHRYLIKHGMRFLRRIDPQ